MVLPKWTYCGPKSKFQDDYIDWINRGAGIAILKKKLHSGVIHSAEEWNPDAVLTSVIPTGGKKFAPAGFTRTVPLQQEVVRPTAEEIRSLIYDKELVGIFEGASILDVADFNESIDSSGAIPVADTTGNLSEGILFYLPAPLIPVGKMNQEKFDLLDPQYLSLKRGEMPTYVFWLPKNWSDKKPTEGRTARAKAPSPEPVAGPSRTDLEVSTEKAEAGKEPKFTVEVFNPQAEEDPIEFLELYNDTTKGYNAIRSRMMLREEDIDRVKYDSPCLRHPTKEQLEKMPKMSAPLRKLPEITEDDPSFVNFKKKLVDRDDNRKAKLFPDPVFTPKYCNYPHPDSPKDPKKVNLTRDLYMEYWHRAKLAETEVEKRSTCCRACGLLWNKTKESQHAHYEKHRQEHNIWLELVQPKSPRLEPPIRASTLAPPSEGVPQLSSFRALEKIIEAKENELLHRAQICFVCDEVLDYASHDPQEHYAQHADQRNAIRACDLHSKATKTKSTLTDAIETAVEETARNVVEEVVEAAVEEATNTDTTLPTPQSRVFTPLKAAHPLVKRAEEEARRKLASKYNLKSASRSRSSSRLTEDRSRQLGRKRSLSSPFVSPQTVNPKQQASPPATPTKPKVGRPAKNARVESKPTGVAEANMFYDERTGQYKFLGASQAKVKRSSQAKGVEVAPGVQKLSNFPPFPKDGGITPGLFQPIIEERSISDETSEYESDSEIDFLSEAMSDEAELQKMIREGEWTEDDGGDLPSSYTEGTNDVSDDEVEKSDTESSMEVIQISSDSESESEVYDEEEQETASTQCPKFVSPRPKIVTELPARRPTSVKASRKRKASDAPYVDVPSTPHPDDVSPVLRAPKKARKTKDATYKPFTAEEAPTTPTPKQSKRQTTRQAKRRAKKQAKKAAKESAKSSPAASKVTKTPSPPKAKKIPATKKAPVTKKAGIEVPAPVKEAKKPVATKKAAPAPKATDFKAKKATARAPEEKVYKVVKTKAAPKAKATPKAKVTPKAKAAPKEKATPKAKKVPAPEPEKRKQPKRAAAQGIKYN